MNLQNCRKRVALFLVGASIRMWLIPIHGLGGRDMDPFKIRLDFGRIFGGFCTCFPNIRRVGYFIDVPGKRCVHRFF